MKINHSSPINLLDNPKFKQFMDDLARLDKETATLSLDEERKICTRYFLNHNPVYEPVDRIENITISGRQQQTIPIRVYIPAHSKPLPVLVYFHGGGWVYGSVEQSDPFCRKLANHLGCIVASVEYRLAPENPFPKPLEDCYDATLWISQHAHLYGGDPKSIIVGGASAGGNLAAAVALMACNEMQPSIRAQFLICPAITTTIDESHYNKNPDRYFITKQAMRFFWNSYLQSPADKSNPYASLEKATHIDKLPPTLMITAEYDPLQKEAEEFVKQLQKAKVPVFFKCFSKTIHDFLNIPIYEESEKLAWIAEIADLFKQVQKST